MRLLIFILTSFLNTVLIKWVYTMKAVGSDGKMRYFQHPVALTFLMFFGEFLCFVFFKSMFCLLRRRNDDSENTNLLTSGEREFSPISMLLPAFLDAITTVMLLTGLYLTYATSFQNIRASSIIFVGLFASIHLNQQLSGRHWWAMLIIIISLAIIISSDMHRVLYDNKYLIHANTNAILCGDLLVVCASIFKAAKMIYEEKYIKDCPVPILQAIGWQGIFGLCITLILGICMNFMPTPFSPFNDSSRQVFDDFQDIYSQLKSNPQLVLALSIFIFSAALHGYTALYIISISTSANFVMADYISTVLVWILASVVDWESINLQTVLGYCCLILGLIHYRRALLMQLYRSIRIRTLRIIRLRYVDMSADPTPAEGGFVPSNRPADII